MTAVLRSCSVTRLLAVLAVGLLPVGVAACGGAGTPLSRAEFVRQAGRECATLQRVSDDLARAQRQDAIGPEVGDYLGEAADGLRTLATSLGGLEPPTADADDAEALVRTLGDYGDGLDALADRVGPGDTLTVTLGSSQAVVRRLNDLAQRASRLVADLGIDECRLSG